MSDRTKWTNSDKSTDTQRKTADTYGAGSSRNDLGRPQTDGQKKQETTEKYDTPVNRNDAGKPNVEADKASESELKHAGTEKGFDDKERLQEHYDKHNNEFHPPFENKEAYESSAKKFMHDEPDAQTLEKTRTSGDRVRYNQSTEEFGVARKDGTVRTYYTPDPAKHGYATNREYYDAQ